jgi:chromosomal replication initiation ATPase DnaA
MVAETLGPSLAPDFPEDATLGQKFAQLIEAALAGNQAAVRQLGTTFARAYRGPDRNEVSGRISSLVRQRATSLDSVRSVERLPLDNKSRVPLLEEQPWPTMPLLLDSDQEVVLQRFVSEAANAERLCQAGLGSRFNLLLSGPPGTGKTFIAGHVAARLRLPFYTVRLDTVVSSLLGDTAKNIRALFEFAMHGPGFLFIDEIDAIAKRRDDQRELGEIKRVVNTLIQGLDLLDPRTVIIAATNHAHLLDPAIFRRFPYHLDVPLPNLDLRIALWRLYLFEDQDRSAVNLLGRISEGLSCSDIRELAIASRRTALLEGRDIALPNLAEAVLASQTGKLRLPHPGDIDRDKKSELNVRLREIGHSTYEEIGEFLGISKQAAMKNIKRRERRKDSR